MLRCLFIVLIMIVSLWCIGCQHQEAHEEHEHHRIVATSPLVKDTVITQEYVCRIRSQRHIEIQALERGYLEEIKIREGQFVKEGEVLFQLVPAIYQAHWEAELAELRLAELELNNTRKLFEDKVVSDREVALFEAKLARAKARVKLAEAELNFTTMRAPFDGIVDRLHKQTGSLVEEGDVLTTLSDNSTMWVYFNVPEVRYLEYMATKDEDERNQEVLLKLANGQLYEHKGRIAAIEADFDFETGNIAFRADFPNPARLLRHGQTGNILLRKPLKNVIMIPQRASFEILDRRYVYVVDDEHKVVSREITVLHELDDVFIIKSGLSGQDKIILEGIRQVENGEHIEYEYQPPEEVFKSLKYHAE
ncbi:MAG: hypothetical protein KatS3mg113_0584 [Planctomycetaceae bacterium]|nr:MAG: hypothetical protein KatS3mg113_0584 [Planctomycetaceae bacterium]